VDYNKIDNAKQYTYFSGNFNCHGDVLVQCGVHPPMEHIQSLTRSHWMPPLGKGLGHIAPAVTMVEDFK
jgi:hypothetical protein